MTCEQGGDCELQDLAYSMGVTGRVSRGNSITIRSTIPTPSSSADYNKCVLCERCVRACDEIAGIQAIDYTRRGFDTKVVTPIDGGLPGQRLRLLRPVRPGLPGGRPDGEEGKGAGPRLGDEESPHHLPLLRRGLPAVAPCEGRPDHQGHGCERSAEPNQGRLCVKGRFGYDFIYSEDRLKTPLIKENGSSGRPPGMRPLDLLPTSSRRSSQNTDRMPSPASVVPGASTKTPIRCRSSSAR